MECKGHSAGVQGFRVEEKWSARVTVQAKKCKKKMSANYLSKLT